jgi:prepilin-type N-terminal cleavage/methylation domain-containing protein
MRNGNAIETRATGGRRDIFRASYGVIVQRIRVPRARRRAEVLQCTTTRPEPASSGECGFSLFELLVVIAIIGVLAAAAIPRFSDFRAAAYDSRSQQDLRNLASAQELYRAANETYAADVADLPSFKPSEGVEVTIDAADQTAFRASAEHPGGRNTYSWDSEQQPSLTSEPNG